MASLQQRQGWFHLLFRYRGRQHSHALKTKDRREAEAVRGSVNRLLIRIRNQEFPPPPAQADVAAYLLAGGNAPPASEPTVPTVPLRELADRYLAAHSNGAMEANSLATAKLHLSHLVTALGERLVTHEITARVLQTYLDTRGRAKGRRGNRLSPVTLKKEISTLRAAWNWGVRTQMTQGLFPGRGLTYPKCDEKPPFQTLPEIERKVARGGLNPEQVAELWDSLFLTKTELAAFLDLAKGFTKHPMVAFAAHTGARRSEVLRVQVDDLDFEVNSAVIREKKRVRGRRSTRRVPISGYLKGVLQAWLARHPGGQFVFCRTPTGSQDSPPRSLTGVDAASLFRSWFAGRNGSRCGAGTCCGTRSSASTRRRAWTSGCCRGGSGTCRRRRIRGTRT